MRKLVIALCLLAPATAAAREYEISIGSAVHVARSSSLDAVSEDDAMPFADFGAAVRVADAPFLDGLYAEARWQIGGSYATDFGNVDTDLTLQVMQVGVKGMRKVYPRLRAFARADVGLVNGELTMESWGSGGESRIFDEDWAACAYAGAGIDLTALQAGEDARNPDLAFGFRLELGWLAAGSLSYAAKPDYPDDDLARVDTAAAPLGSIDASGYTVRFSFVGRF